jgi:hypothetical protein
MASAAACTAPSTDYGQVTGLSVNITNTATYRIWSRMSAPDNTNDTYLLEVDGNTCYNVGGSAVPTYSSGATTYFANDTTNWINKTSGGTTISMSLSAGSHTLKLIGNADGVVVDRIVFTQDTACVPSGVGDNCATSPDTTNPVVSITTPSSDGTTITTTTNVVANATDNVSVSKVEFFVDGNSIGTDTTADGSNNFTASLNPTGLSAGTHNLTAKATDGATNATTSGVRTFNIGSVTYNPADINMDHVVNITDLSILSSKWLQTGASLGRADMNTDGIVNITDLSILSSNWGKTQ